MIDDCINKIYDEDIQLIEDINEVVFVRATHSY